jgi:hypothetical protein
VAAKADELGLGRDDWQVGFGKLALAKRADGKFAAGIGGVVASIPRQVGKTYIVTLIVFCLALLNPGLTVLWTAHRMKTAGETFAKIQAFTRKKKIAPHILKVTTGAGDEVVYFRNGSRIMFGARERGFGRGFDNVDVEVFDEAQILTEAAVEDMVPATNVAPNPLLFFIGTPPRPKDPGEIFSGKRKEALSGEDEDTVYVEFSADPNADENDRKQWARANPSYPHRTDDAAMLRMKKALNTPGSFRREALGIWDDDSLQTVVDMDHFADLTKLAPAGDPVAYGLDMNPEQTVASVSVALRWPDGSVHVEEAKRFDLVRLGAESVVDWLCERAGRRVPIVLDAFSPARILKPRLQLKKAKLFVLQSNELLEACGGFVQAINDSRLSHAGDGLLTTALEAAEKKPVGKSGGWKWKLADSLVDNTPLMSATCAHYGAVKAKPRKAGNGSGKVVVL